MWVFGAQVPATSTANPVVAGSSPALPAPREVAGAAGANTLAPVRSPAQPPQLSGRHGTRSSGLTATDLSVVEAQLGGRWYFATPRNIESAAVCGNEGRRDADSRRVRVYRSLPVSRRA